MSIRSLARTCIRLIALAVPLTAGCSNRRAVPLTPTPIAIPGTTEVVRHSGGSVFLDDARISNDSIYGTVGGGFPNYNTAKTAVSVALSDVVRAESSTTNVERTIGLVFLIYAFTFAIMMSGVFGGGGG